MNPPLYLYMPGCLCDLNVTFSKKTPQRPTLTKVSYSVGHQATPLFAVFSITLMGLEVYLCVCIYLIQVGLPQEAKRHCAFVCYHAVEPVTFIRYSACA